MSEPDRPRILTSPTPRAIAVTLAVLPWVIAAVAIAMRVSGTSFDFPIRSHPDELPIYRSALRIARHGNMNPHFFAYPSLLIYLYAGLIKVGVFIGWLPVPHYGIPESAHYTMTHLGRVAVAILSGATVFVVHRVGKTLFDHATGIIAAIVLTGSVLHLEYSHTVTVDAPMGFFAACALLGAARVYKCGRQPRDYAFAAIAVGLAAGTKYTGLPAALPLFIAHFAACAEANERPFDRRLLLAVLLMPLTFAATSPYVFLDFGNAYNAITAESLHYRNGHPGHEAVGNVSFFENGQHLLEGMGVLPLALAGVGLLAALWNRRYRAHGLMLIAFVVAYVGLIGSYRVHFARNLVAIVPPLAVLTGFGARSLIVGAFDGRFRFRGRVVAAGIVTVVLGVGLSTAVADGFDYARQTRLPDTRVVAQQWVYANLEEGTMIHREYYTPPISDDRYRASIVGIAGLVRRPIPEAHYLIASSEDYGRYLFQPAQYPEPARRYRALFAENVEVRRFEADGETMLGPTIRIIRTRRRNEMAQTARDKPLPVRENTVPDGEIRFGHIVASGPLSAAQVRTTIRRLQTDLVHCYQAGLSRQPAVQGRISIRYTIDEDGSVSEAAVASANFSEDITHECLTRVFRRAHYDENDAETVVTFPLVLSASR